MKIWQTIILLIILTTSNYCIASTLSVIENDSTDTLYQKGAVIVNHCTPWHHLQCIAITGTEVYEDGRDGKKVRHWWRMSYIGRACTERYGTTFGKLFEGIWVIPHYTGVAVGSSFGYLVYAIRGPRDPEKVAARKLKRQQRKEKQSTPLPL